MFRSASQIDSERTASSLRRIKANWERTADNWFTGSVDSIDRRIALCERLIHQASQATARLLDRPESAHYMKLASDLQADHEALTQMRRDLLTAASDREAGHGVNCPQCGKYLHDSEARLNHAHGPDGETYDGGPQYGFENRQDYRNRMKSSGHNIGGIPDEYNDDYGPLPDQDELRRQVYEDEHSGDDEPPTPQDILNFWELENRDPYGAPPRRRRH